MASSGTGPVSLDRSAQAQSRREAAEISDGNAAAKFLGGIAAPKNGERQILNGKIAADQISRIDPAADLRIVSLIQAGGTGHGRAGSKRFCRPSQQDR